MLTLTPSELNVPQLHQYLLGAVGPRPICFASTVDAKGNHNLAPFSFLMYLVQSLLLLFSHQT